MRESYEGGLLIDSLVIYTKSLCKVNGKPNKLWAMWMFYFYYIHLFFTFTLKYYTRFGCIGNFYLQSQYSRPNTQGPHKKEVTNQAQNVHQDNATKLRISIKTVQSISPPHIFIFSLDWVITAGLRPLISLATFHFLPQMEGSSTPAQRFFK